MEDLGAVPSNSETGPVSESVDGAMESSGKDETQAKKLRGLVCEDELFHDPEQRPYIRMPVKGHHEVWPLRSPSMRAWLYRLFYKATGRTPSTQAVEETLRTLEGEALFDGAEHPVHVRLAEFEDNIYLDLADDTWRVVEVTPAGWCVVTDPPVRFRRPAGMAPLPVPLPGGKLSDLRRFVNVEDDDQWRLVASWVIAAARPRGPYPVLGLHGEQGSAKSTAARVLRSVIDPNAVPLRSEPKEPRDLMIAATRSWILNLDNLSHLQPWLSDALCRLSTGGGFATRMLYTDEDEALFDAMRPVIINSIEELATRPDLLDRALIIKLPSIPEDRRRPEDEFWAEFEAARPALLGALLNIVAGGLDRLPYARLDGFPRMADFAKWITAAEPALGWPQGTFMRTYTANRATANETALEASVITAPLLDFLHLHGGKWSGATITLLRALALHAGDIAKTRAWPKTAQGLTGALERIVPNLRAAGIEVTRHKSGGKRWLEVRSGGNLVPHAPHVPGPGETSISCRDESTDDPMVEDLLAEADEPSDAEVGGTVSSSSPTSSLPQTQDVHGKRDEGDEGDEVAPASSEEINAAVQTTLAEEDIAETARALGINLDDEEAPEVGRPEENKAATHADGGCTVASLTEKSNGRGDSPAVDLAADAVLAHLSAHPGPVTDAGLRMLFASAGGSRVASEALRKLVDAGMLVRSGGQRGPFKYKLAMPLSYHSPAELDELPPAVRS